MNINTQKKQLKTLIEDYLAGETSYKELSSYAWEIISLYEKKADQLPKYLEQDEGIFWYSIWQIQHLASEDHEKDNSLKSALLEILEYLNLTKELPRNLYGKRP